ARVRLSRLFSGEKRLDPRRQLALIEGRASHGGRAGGGPQARLRRGAGGGGARNANFVGVTGVGVKNCSRRSAAQINPPGLSRRSRMSPRAGNRRRSVIAAFRN